MDDYTPLRRMHPVSTTQARGGEVITETACKPGQPNCHFPITPDGPWKLGLQAHRDAPVDDAGIEMVPGMKAKRHQP